MWEKATAHFLQRERERDSHFITSPCNTRLILTHLVVRGSLMTNELLFGKFGPFHIFFKAKQTQSVFVSHPAVCLLIKLLI